MRKNGSYLSMENLDLDAANSSMSNDEGLDEVKA